MNSGKKQNSIKRNPTLASVLEIASRAGAEPHPGMKQAASRLLARLSTQEKTS